MHPSSSQLSWQRTHDAAQYSTAEGKFCCRNPLLADFWRPGYRGTAQEPNIQAPNGSKSSPFLSYSVIIASLVSCDLHTILGSCTLHSFLPCSYIGGTKGDRSITEYTTSGRLIRRDSGRLAAAQRACNGLQSPAATKSFLNNDWTAHSGDGNWAIGALARALLLRFLFLNGEVTSVMTNWDGAALSMLPSAFCLKSKVVVVGSGDPTSANMHVILLFVKCLQFRAGFGSWRWLPQHTTGTDEMIVGELFNCYLAAIVPCLHCGEINLDSANVSDDVFFFFLL